MSDSHCVQIEFDDRRFEALESEASRLGLDVSEVVKRATSAWLCDMTEVCVTSSASGSTTAAH